MSVTTGTIKFSAENYNFAARCLHYIGDIAQFEKEIKVHEYALTAFNEASKYYHVTTKVEKAPDISMIKDENLPELFENNEVRQIIHITYGLILGKKDNSGNFVFKNKLYKLWQQNENKYRDALVKHIGKHLQLLQVKIT